MYPNKYDYYMQVNGLRAQINTPDALIGEEVHGLPPYKPVEFYPVDEYPACPDNWMHGSDKASSYFIPVDVGKGMWFDFTPNQTHTHDVAIVISVQGINPVTGQQVTALNLEHYKTKCPVHDVEFQQDRFCPECGYKWPAQNYISTTTGETLWLDGFRNAEGLVRQYILTEEECRGVAAQKIGEDRVWAIGFAFYLSKSAKPKPVGGFVSACGLPWDDQYSLQQYASGSINLDSYYHPQTADGTSYLASNKIPSNLPTYYEASNKISPSVRIPSSGNFDLPNPPTCDQAMESDVDADYEALGSIEPVTQTKVEIGAGAQIQQDVGVDPNKLEYWQEEPVGMIYVNYVTREVCDRILAAGKRQEKQNGPLEGLKVGN